MSTSVQDSEHSGLEKYGRFSGKVTFTRATSPPKIQTKKMLKCQTFFVIVLNEMESRQGVPTP